ncbi:MAG: capsular biosynthesis protein [Candidatus Aenigmarchaeota archaeon]|nr:capsular biosynthesis protein [Candidatus Aenigmarchaeota archaeon]
MKIALPSSAGGHITELMQIRGSFGEYETFFVTVKRKDTEDLSKKEKVYFVEDTGRNPVGLVKNIISSLKIMFNERPDVIITTGAGAAIPASIIGKLLGAKLVYIESYCRVKSKSWSGRLLYPFSDVFLVQWPDMVTMYGKKTRYWGGVF